MWLEGYHLFLAAQQGVFGSTKWICSGDHPALLGMVLVLREIYDDSGEIT